MKVSFLVTYYNQKEYVAQSLDSILNIEKPCDWEILVGDDGSDDGTIDVVREYIDRYPDNISLYVMDREPGKKYEVVRRASANRLNLTNRMTGDIFCVLDGDDRYCNTGFLCRALDIFAQNPELSVVAFGYHMFSDTQGILSNHTLPAGFVETERYLSENMYTPSGACVLRNHMTPQRKDYLNSIVYYDDNNIVINNLHFGNMYAVDEVVYSYRQTETSVYNSMKFAERAVLNAQSFDVDMLLLPGWEQAFITRYRMSLLQTWALGKSLKRLLGQEKWKNYMLGCRKLENSVTYILLNKTSATKQEKQRIRSIISRIMRMDPQMACVNILRCWKRRIIG